MFDDWNAYVNKGDNLRFFNNVPVIGLKVVGSGEEAFALRNQLVEKGVTTAGVVVSSLINPMVMMEKVGLVDEIPQTQAWKFSLESAARNDMNESPSTYLSIRVFASREQLIKAGISVPEPIETVISLKEQMNRLAEEYGFGARVTPQQGGFCRN